MKYFPNTRYPYGTVTVKGINHACGQITIHCRVWMQFNCTKPAFASAMENAWYIVQRCIQNGVFRDFHGGDNKI